MRRLVVGLIVLVALAVGIDRVAVVVASHVVADQLAKDQTDCARPGVDIGGFPFLTQAAKGRYSTITLTTSCAGSVGLRLDPVVVHLHGVHVSASQIIHGSVQQVAVDSATGTVTIPFSAINSQLASRQLRLSAGPGNTIVVSGDVTVAGQNIAAHGTGAVSISGGDLTVSVTSVTTASGTVDTGAGFGVSLPLPALPFQLERVGIGSSSAGVVISARASNLELSR